MANLSMPNMLDDLLRQLRPYLVDIGIECVSTVLQQMNSVKQYPEKINITQAAELTGFSKNSLYQMHSKGNIPGALKVGGKLLFDTETLRNWRNSGGLL